MPTAFHVKAEGTENCLLKPKLLDVSKNLAQCFQWLRVSVLAFVMAVFKESWFADPGSFGRPWLRKYISFHFFSSCYQVVKLMSVHV